MAVLEKAEVPQSVTNRDRQDWVTLLAAVEEVLFPHMLRSAKDWVARHFEPMLADENWLVYEPALVNGDLASYHILYDPDTQRINGVIDFGTAGIGDPAVDFACIIGGFGESFLRRMRKFYPAIADAIDRARFWAGTLELQWLLRGMRTNDPSWFMIHIGSPRDVNPPGSGW
jgi:aminoglycoside 2''-phosphotransferase